ncbi:MAG: CAP domain-containing protein [Gemmatimonadota bacterium]|nr:CAP domain-containing protein [Gemmatimonadota bacterium]
MVCRPGTVAVGVLGILLTGCVAIAQAAAVAEGHSRDMRRRGYFSHTTPEGLSPFDRLSRAGIAFRSAGENIAEGATTAEKALSQWLGSPSHRAAIEDCSYTHHGAGREGVYWTHLFLRP